jgi:hypothetical protein
MLTHPRLVGLRMIKTMINRWEMTPSPSLPYTQTHTQTHTHTPLRLNSCQCSYIPHIESQNPLYSTEAELARRILLAHSLSPSYKKYFYPVCDRPTNHNRLSNMRRYKYDDVAWEGRRGIFDKAGCRRCSGSSSLFTMFSSLSAASPVSLL